MPRKEIPAQALLGALPLFKAVDASSLSRLAEASTRNSLERGQVLFRHGEAPTGMYVVIHGEIKLMAPHGNRERLVGVVGPGRSFGEPVMFLERPALVDAVAATDALVLHLPKEAVFAEIERDPVFARRIIAALSERAESLVLEMDRQALGGGRARLVRYLLQHAGAASGDRSGSRGRSGSGSFELPASKASVAAQLHLTPEHFSRLLAELAAAGLIEVDRRQFTIPDLQRLAQFSASAASSPDGRTRSRTSRARPPA